MRPSKPWYRSGRDQWCCTIDGRVYVLAKGKAAKAEAVREFHRLMAERGIAKPPDSRPTVLSVVEAYLDHAVGVLSSRSFSERRGILAQFIAAHGGRAVDDLKAIHLSAWIDGQVAWKSDWTRNHAAAVIKRPFAWATAMGIIPDSPLKTVTRAPGRPRRPIVAAEFSALMRGAPGPRGRPFRQVLAFLRLTGMRPGEASALRWEHVDLAARAIRLQEHKTARKTGRDRVVPLTRPVVRLLARRKSERPDDAHVFVNAHGSPWTRCSLSLRLQRARKRTGLPADAKIYGLRHRFGTDAIVAGVDIKTLAVLMGHTSTKMTEHYLHLASHPGYLADAMERATKGRRG